MENRKIFFDVNVWGIYVLRHCTVNVQKVLVIDSQLVTKVRDKQK
jgi:hypothetical protein